MSSTNRQNSLPHPAVSVGLPGGSSATGGDEALLSNLDGDAASAGCSGVPPATGGAGIDLSRLENIKQHGGKTEARCPACQKIGADKTGDHLWIGPDGRFGCLMFPGASGADHRKRIFALVGTPSESPRPLPPAKPTKRKPKVHATQDKAAQAALWSAGKATGHKWQVTRRYAYTDKGGREIAAVLRFDRADGATDADGKAIKTFRPIHAVGNGWATGDPEGLWPLFRLPEIMASEGGICIGEGEKTADAGAGIGLTCTTSAHGSKSPQKTDWTSLRGRDVAILPDNDRAGRGYAEAVAALVHKAGARSIRVVELPGLPPKGDLADFVANGGTVEQVREAIRTATLWTPGADSCEAEKCLDPAEAARAGRPFAMTDLGNAERIVARHGQNFKFDTARQRWRIWDGRRWAVDSSLRLNRWAADSARAIRQEAAVAPAGNGGERDLGAELFRHAVKSESRDRLSAAIEVAKAQPGVAAASDAWDSDPMLFNCANGTIDLRNGKLRPHNRADGLTKLSPVAFDPDAHCDRWDRFLFDCTEGDPELVEFLQVVAGYTATGDTTEEKLFLIWGPENSGKTTFLETLRTVLGDYSATINPEMLLKQKNVNGGGATPDIARLVGARLAAGSEMEEGRTLAEALAKNLTGGESICARHLYAETFEFMPQFKLWLAVNHCPKVSADDGAIWRRILRIGFPHTVPPEKRDKGLKKFLRSDGAPAVLAWAVKGCLQWLGNGLTIPEAVRRSTAAYRNESDPLATFFEDCLRFDGQAWTVWADIWNTYCEHAAEQGTTEKYRVSPRRIQERLTKHECAAERRYIGRGWRGVELRTEWKHDAHVAYDASPETFPHEGKARESFRPTDISDMSVMGHPKTPIKTPVSLFPEDWDKSM
jgi:putative DNA primase/helicase